MMKNDGNWIGVPSLGFKSPQQFLTERVPNYQTWLQVVNRIEGINKIMGVG